jgi:hypothetical protein
MARNGGHEELRQFVAGRDVNMKAEESTAM